MRSQTAKIRKSLLGISPAETTCKKRGFDVRDPAKKERLETIGRTFVKGYHAALLNDPGEGLYIELEKESAELQGFIYEGAGMGLALLDALTPWNRSRHAHFLQKFGSPHIYMLHIGFGWALARTPWRITRRMQKLDPLLRWLVLDGYGFHQGYFKWKKYVASCQDPGEIHGYGKRAFDQGLGRSLWFVAGADAETAIRYLKNFSTARQKDLWSGLGLACTYAGGIDEGGINTLIEASGEYFPMFAQGSVFAAKARERAGIISPETEQTTKLLCNRTAREAAKLSDEALIDLPDDGKEPAWEIWRQRIQANFTK